MMEEHSFDLLRPRINVFVSNSLGRKFFNRKYFCTLCEPETEFSSFSQFDRHGVTHICKGCLYVFKNVSIHTPLCTRMNQIGMGPNLNAPLLPDGLLDELEQFEITDTVQFGTICLICHFKYEFTSLIILFD